MMPQFSNIRNKAKNYRNIAIGLFIFSIGLFKKSVLADTFSEWVAEGFDVAETLSLFEAWATSFSYTFQLYFDFSGYADMAIGAALIFNIKLPINFNSPYKALNIQDFWRRWHMTLSRFLKEYVYIPLGGNRGGDFRTYNNLLATFIIGGIWHGAGWTFVFWGVIHGMAIVINRLWHLTSIKLPAVVAWFITFNFVNVAWIFFRAKEWGDAVRVLTSMFSLDNVVLPGMLKNKLYFLNEYGVEFGSFLINIGSTGVTLPLWLFVAFLIVIFSYNSNRMAVNLRLSRNYLLLSSALLGVGIMFVSKGSEFLYFNF
jgi:D-alanyl-lipoteichoic acid acyltransferase DltB (MBOAT superfamily)